MTRACIKVMTWLLAGGMLLAASIAQAALPIDLEVAAEQEAPFGAMQEWGRVLAEMDLARVRLRGARGDDKPGIETTGEGAAAHYNVTGLLTRGDVLVLPGGKFSQSDRARLKQFFQELPTRAAEAGVEHGAFGLPIPQLKELLEDLETAVEQSTKGQRPEAVVAAITAQIKTPVGINPTARAVLRDAKPMDVEFKGMASGTALAAVLRAANLGLLPEHATGKAVALRVAPLAADEESWPVGWKPQTSPSRVAPAMYKYTTVEIEGYSLAKALEALAPHMGVPLVFDERTLAARHIDPAAVKVKFAAGKTYIRRAVDSILSQARLAGELRVDEAGRPFYWMTQYGQESPHAKELVRDANSK